MCQNCKAKAAEVNAKYETRDVAELVKMLGVVRGTEDVSIVERMGSVIEFASLFEDPMELIGFAHHLGTHYLAEKDRADKLQAALDMVCRPQTSTLNAADALVASQERQISGLKSTMGILMGAFKLMSSQAGFIMPEMNNEDPMAVRELLGALADELDTKKSRLEDMMRELTHRHDLTKQPHKAQHANL